MSINQKFALIALLSSIVAVPAPAEVTLTVLGSVDILEGAAQAPNGFFDIGDAVSITISFDEFSSLQQTGVIERRDVITLFEGSVGTYEFGGASGTISLRNDDDTFGNGDLFDSVSFSFNNELVNNLFGIDRNDFAYDSGDVGGFRLNGVSFSTALSDPSLLADLGLDLLATENFEGSTNLFSSRVFYSNEALGVIPGTVEISIHSITVSSNVSCPADMTSDGSLDFFDVSAFLTAFSQQDTAADFTGDGSFDFFDVSAFLIAFSAGCP